MNYNMFQFISVFLHYLVQVLVCSAINQYSFNIQCSFSFFLEYFSSSFSFSKRIAIILILLFLLVMKIALSPSASSYKLISLEIGLRRLLML